MELLLISLIAGMLTVLAPCVIAVIPVLLSRGANGKSIWRSLRVIVGLAGSIIIFTLLLKATTLLISVPPSFWQAISGGIIVLFGLTMLFPGLWEQLMLRTRAVFGAQSTLQKAQQASGAWGDVLIGASLGPVFSACSPTYALLVAVVLPATPLIGIVNLLVFVLGLSLMLLLVAYGGRTLVKKLGWGINPHGVFRRALGCVLIVVGLAIVTGLDKQVLGWLVESGVYDFQIDLETEVLPDTI